MSAPTPEAETYDYMIDSVEEYCRDWTGEPQDAPYFYEMIKDPEKRRGEAWECFVEWINEGIENS